MEESFMYGNQYASVGTSSADGHIEYKGHQFDEVTSYFALFDGQQGNEVAKFCAKFLHEEIKKCKDLLKSNEDEDDVDDDDDECATLCNAITKAFLNMDKMIQQKRYWTELNEEDIAFDKEDLIDAGSTACLVFLRKNHLIFANAGLSRCVISRMGHPFAITTDHEPDVLEETNRIKAAKGFVSAGRVKLDVGTEDGLTFSRAIGYLKYKKNRACAGDKQIVIAKPEIKMVELKDDIDYIVLASAEFWSVVKNDDAVKLVREDTRKGLLLSEVCDNLRSAYYNVPTAANTRDNIMIVIIKLDTQKWQVPPEDSSKSYGNKVLFKQRSVLSSVEDPTSWTKLRETYVLAEDRPPAVVCELLRLASLKSIADGDENGPKFTLPKRPERLYEYNAELQQVCLRRSGTYLTQSAQKGLNMARCIAIVESLIKKSETNSVRGVSYRAENVCGHDASDEALVEVSVLAECTRTSLHVYGSPQGSISGAILLFAEGRRVDCENGGVAGEKVLVEAEKGLGVTHIVPKDGSTIDYILFVEKESVFFILMELDFPKKHNCVLITGKGMPDVATRILLCKLEACLKKPTYCLVDCNPEGLQIFSVCKFGSRNLAPENTGLALSSLKLIGMFPEHMALVKKSCRQLLTEKDKRLIVRLLARDYVDQDTELKSHLKAMERKGYKVQIESIQESLGSDALVNIIETQIDLMRSREPTTAQDGIRQAPSDQYSLLQK